MAGPSITHKWVCSTWDFSLAELGEPYRKVSDCAAGIDLQSYLVKIKVQIWESG